MLLSINLCINSNMQANKKLKHYHFILAPTKKEKGCVKPLYGVKSKCILKVVPRKKKCTSFSIDEKCKLYR